MAQEKRVYLLPIKTSQRKTTAAIMLVFITMHIAKIYLFGIMMKNTADGI